MPRITTYGYSNADTVREPALFDQQGGVRIPVNNPKKNLGLAVVLGGVRSAGTSSSTSERQPEPNGSSAPETEQSTQSPAQDAVSRSGQGRQVRQVRSSTALSTDGSSQETGPDQPRQPDSSAASALATPVTRDTTSPKQTDDAEEMMHLARQAFDSGDYDMAEEILNEAESMDANLQADINSARAEIEAARKAK